MRLSLTFALVIVALAAALSLATTQLALLLARIGKADPTLARFPGPFAIVASLVWSAGFAVLLFAALATLDRPPIATVGAMWATPQRQGLPSVLAVGMLAVCVAAASFWSRLPWIGRVSAAFPESYGHRYPPMTRGRLVTLLLIRYPLTVSLEETLFRGFLQRELANGLIIASLLFAAYHLQQWRTIPSLVPYAFMFGILYSWTGWLWAPAVAHYCLDAGYALLFPRAQLTQALDRLRRRDPGDG